MKYLPVSEIAKRRGVSERTVRNRCAAGRIPNAFLTGKTWNIPEDAVRPARVKKVGRAEKSAGIPAAEKAGGVELPQFVRTAQKSPLRGNIKF